MNSINVDDPDQPSAAKKGGWITIPFILGTMAGLTIGFGTLLSNLEVYLIQEFNIKRITAAQIFNVISGFVRALPIMAAILADSYLNCYTVIWISSVISSLGMVLLTITAAISRLKPPPCQNGSNICTEPTKFQSAVLYLSLFLAVLGMGGNRITIGSMGAHQLDKPKDCRKFFNWYIFVINVCLIVSSTALVYVTEHVSWAWGFGISSAANTFGVLLLFAGTHYYRQLKPRGSPFAGFGRVVVKAFQNKGIPLSENPGDYYQDPEKNMNPTLPSKFFRFLNGAALKTESDVEINKSKRKSRQLCSITKVEDLKDLIKLVPLFASGLLLCVPFVIQSSLGILQALTMDPSLGHHFKVPAAMIVAFISISTSITIVFIDLLLLPFWSKFCPKPITPLRRIGIGHLINVLSMAVLALVEAKRLRITRLHSLQDQDNAKVPMSMFWLVPPLALVGMGEAFHLPGHISFYHERFPDYIKNTSVGVVALFYGIAFYIGNALIHVIHTSTHWLPDNINKGRLDIVYWLITIIVGVNFCYFLLCASLYKYKIPENVKVDVNVNRECKG